MARILVVDDAQFVRWQLGKFLRDAGHDVAEAANGREAVDQFRKTRPDVVLLDITMPVMDGLQALDAIRRLDPQARVVMCSAVNQMNVVIQALERGATDFVAKPYKAERVLAAVDKALRKAATP